MTDPRVFGESIFKRVFRAYSARGRRLRPFVQTRQMTTFAIPIPPASPLGRILLRRLGIGLNDADQNVGMFVDEHQSVWPDPAEGRRFIPVNVALVRLGNYAIGAYRDAGDNVDVGVATNGRHWVYSENLWRKDAWINAQDERVTELLPGVRSAA